MVPFLIHPELRDPSHKDYRIARTVSWVLLFLLSFNLFYDIYYLIFHSEDYVKQMNNLIGGIIFIALTVLIRYSKKIKPAMTLLLLVTYPTVFISVYHTGGIFSADISWMFFACFATFIFLDYKLGIFLCALSISFIAALYFMQEGDFVDDNYFKKYVIANNSTHYFFTIVFIFCLIAVILTVFSINLKKANEKIDMLSKQKIDYLEEKIKEKTQELSSLRSNLAKDFHDEMGNKLASINIISQAVGHKLEQSKQDNVELKQMLQTIEKRSNELYQGTKDFIWSIDYKSDYISEFFVYMRDFAENFFNSVDISFYAEKEFNIKHSSRIEADAIRQLVLICKEILTNAAKHSAATEVRMLMKEENDKLVVRISDNGKGFNRDEVNKRGIGNIEQRAQKINALCNLQSSEQGTQYQISVPLSKIPLPI